MERKWKGNGKEWNWKRTERMECGENGKNGRKGWNDENGEWGKKPKMKEGIESNTDIEGKKAPEISKVVKATNST